MMMMLMMMMMMLLMIMLLMMMMMMMTMMMTMTGKSKEDIIIFSAAHTVIHLKSYFAWPKDSPLFFHFLTLIQAEREEDDISLTYIHNVYKHVQHS